ncbi:hypothetical protein PLICRDRAFT_232661 [Plicaturopsis crispa FD-325 SS-3]|nr:hypothetical protein PLICRDRAFT_232661 [Plicaturopsis crispa FD-325 SS-3]
MSKESAQRELMQEVDRYPIVERAIADVQMLSDPAFAQGIRSSMHKILKRDRGQTSPNELGSCCIARCYLCLIYSTESNNEAKPAASSSKSVTVPRNNEAHSVGKFAPADYSETSAPPTSTYPLKDEEQRPDPDITMTTHRPAEGSITPTSARGVEPRETHFSSQILQTIPSGPENSAQSATNLKAASPLQYIPSQELPRQSDAGLAAVPLLQTAPSAGPSIPPPSNRHAHGPSPTLADNSLSITANSPQPYTSQTVSEHQHITAITGSLTPTSSTASPQHQIPASPLPLPSAHDSMADADALSDLTDESAGA